MKKQASNKKHWVWLMLINIHALWAVIWVSAWLSLSVVRQTLMFRLKLTSPVFWNGAKPVNVPEGCITLTQWERLRLFRWWEAFKGECNFPTLMPSPSFFPRSDLSRVGWHGFIDKAFQGLCFIFARLIEANGFFFVDVVWALRLSQGFWKTSKIPVYINPKGSEAIFI